MMSKGERGEREGGLILMNCIVSYFFFFFFQDSDL